MDFGRLFLPAAPVAETVLRGSIVYLFLFIALRLVLKREAGTIGLADLLLIVLVADATQNAMASGHETISDGLILVTTLMGWNYFLDWLAFKIPSFERFFHPPPLPLVKDGKMLLRNMRRELITTEELFSQLRQHGIEDVSQVRKAQMEGDGRITVIKVGTTESPPYERRP